MEEVHGLGVEDGVGVIVGVCVGVAVGVGVFVDVAVGDGVTAQLIQSSKSGVPKFGPPGPENSINS